MESYTAWALSLLTQPSSPVPTAITLPSLL